MVKNKNNSSNSLVFGRRQKHLPSIGKATIIPAALKLVTRNGSARRALTLPRYSGLTFANWAMASGPPKLILEFFLLRGAHHVCRRSFGCLEGSVGDAGSLNTSAGVAAWLMTEPVDGWNTKTNFY